MSTKREAVLDAAIDLVGTRGLRALTHRAVDEKAGMPPGSTSNYFRTREALLTGITERLEQRDYADWAAQIRLPAPSTLEELIDGFTGFIRHVVDADSTHTLARYAIFVEAQTVPPLRDSVQRGHRRLTEWVETMLAQMNADHTVAKLLVDYADGAILHQLVSPVPDFDPRSAVDRLIRALLGTSVS